MQWIGKTPVSFNEIIGEEMSVDGGTYTNISPTELNSLLEKGDFTFVNVHIPFQRDIPGRDLSIPYNAIESDLDQLPQEKAAKIILYCCAPAIHQRSWRNRLVSRL